MLVGVRDKISKITKAAGVEVIVLPDNRYSITLVLLLLEKKTIRIERKQQFAETSLEVLKEVLAKDIAVYLVVNGRGVLHKKVSESGTDNNVLIQSVLPNARGNDFYIQNIISERGSVISIIRKEQADPILEFLQKENISCIDFSLGGIVVSSVLPMVSEKDKSNPFMWAGHTLDFDRNEDIVEYKFQPGLKSEKYLHLGEERLGEEFLVSYSAAFTMLMNNYAIVPFVSKVIESKEEFLNKQLFKKTGWAILCICLVSLMLNFVFFTSYSAKNNELVQKERKYSTMIVEMEALNKEVKEKESFLSEAGWLRSSSSTYFADRIASTVPPSVKLTELSINPLNERKSKEEKKELFNTGVVLLKGECTRPTELNEWVNQIKEIKKISKARLVNYFFDNKENKGSFSIEIEIEN